MLHASVAATTLPTPSSYPLPLPDITWPCQAVECKPSGSCHAYCHSPPFTAVVNAQSCKSLHKMHFDFPSKVFAPCSKLHAAWSMAATATATAAAAASRVENLIHLWDLTNFSTLTTEWENKWEGERRDTHVLPSILHNIWCFVSKISKAFKNCNKRHL